jgi:hypothetical protein
VLLISFALLSIAMLLGGLLVSGRARRWTVLHGGCGGLGALALAVAMGNKALSGPFATDALVLVGLAFAGGLGLATLARGSRPALVVFLHATAGGLGTLLLAGFVLHR